MSTVSLTLPSDGDTIDASDVNNPLNAIAAVINGGIDSTNVTAGGLTPANLVSGTGSSWAWQSWTPTWTGLTIGNATVNCKYIQIGKTVVGSINVQLGSTSAVTAVTSITLPVTAVAPLNNDPIGTMAFRSSNNAIGLLELSSTSSARFVSYAVSGSVIIESGFTATIPGTWATGSSISGYFTYQAA